MWQIRYAYGVVWEPINLSFFQSAMEWIWLQTDCTTAMTYEPKIHPNALVLVPPQIELGLGSWSTAVSCFVSSSSDWHSFKQKVGTESGKALIQLDSMVMLISVINNDSVFSQLMVHIVHISLYIYILDIHILYIPIFRYQALSQLSRLKTWAQFGAACDCGRQAGRQVLGMSAMSSGLFSIRLGHNSLILVVSHTDYSQFVLFQWVSLVTYWLFP